MKTIPILIVIFSIFAFVRSSNGPAQSSLCTFCKTEVGKAEEYMKTNPPESDFIKWMDKQCDKYSSEEKQICLFFVKQYGKDIYNWLKDSKKTPKEICVDIGFCSKLPHQLHRRRETTSAFNQQDERMKAHSGDPKCFKCSHSIRAIEEFLFSEYSEEEILQFGENLCDYLPPKYVDKCQIFVDKYGDELIQMITEHKCPKLICKTIELCADAEPNFRKHKKFMSFHQHGRKDQFGQQQLQGEGQQVKAKLKPKHRFERMQMDSNYHLNHPHHRRHGKEGHKKNRKCMACKHIVHHIKTYLESSPPEEEIQSHLQSYCDVFSDTERAEKCKTFLDQNTDLILEKVKDGKPCFEICSELEFC
ncbi:saposin-related [Anaeramoeba flamelloides]|uniref:Saposin-related n=1 Tax=Anaeramoeba flamelloides TaxID=1746091 RepID=A0AAV7YN61_9EUKA|nr:saposin-related [Anaeramoeba flamelloides]KAJ6230474.1 saposin-related [Anaeramoeba flamelloides]